MSTARRTYTWPVSTGKRGYTTPSGSYSALSMNEIWYSQAVGQRADAARHFLHEERSCHSWQHGGEAPRHAGIAWLRAPVATERQHAVHLVKTNGLKNTQVVLGGTTPGGEAIVASQPALPRIRRDRPWRAGLLPRLRLGTGHAPRLCRRAATRRCLRSRAAAGSRDPAPIRAISVRANMLAMR